MSKDNRSGVFRWLFGLGTQKASSSPRAQETRIPLTQGREQTPQAPRPRPAPNPPSIDFNIIQRGRVWYVEAWTNKAVSYLRKHLVKEHWDLHPVSNYAEFVADRQTGRVIVRKLERLGFTIKMTVDKLRDEATGETVELN